MTGTPVSAGRSARVLDTDGLDAELIRALQLDGRVSVQDLAAALGASRDLVSQRLRALIEHDGVRVVAALNPVFAGQRLLTHGLVSVDGPVAPVADELARMPEPVFVSMVSGAHPLVFESRHADDAELHALLNRVRAIPSVRRVQVTTYAHVIKGLFIAEYRGDITLDDLDRELITILQRDGRTSYRRLSEIVHLSPSSVRARVHKLLEAGAIRISAVKSGGLSRNRLAIGIGITARGETEPIRRYIAETSAVDFAARSHGNYDFVATVVGTTSAAVLAVIEELRAIPEVSSLETWTHLNIVKEDYARTPGI